MSQNRFRNLSIINIEKDIVINIDDILNDFSKTERTIELFFMPLTFMNKKI